MVMWPLPYSDVTDAWRIPDRRRRLRIAAAGMWTELAIAGWALLGSRLAWLL
jgi:putative peptide zinc metalloprotease protein